MNQSAETWRAAARAAMAAAVHVQAKGWLSYHAYLLAKAERFLAQAERCA